MKNGFWDRVLIFLYVLLTAALTVLVALRAFNIDLVDSLMTGLSSAAPGIVWKLIICGLGAVIVLLGVYTVVTITPSRMRRNDFITISADDGGQVKVAMPAVREMVKQAVGSISGADEMKIDVSGEGDNVTVGISMDMTLGTHVPSVTAGIQHSVRAYIESNCGIHVRDVSVVINAMLPAPEGAQAAAQPVVNENSDTAVQSEWFAPQENDFEAKSEDTAMPESEIEQTVADYTGDAEAPEISDEEKTEE